MVTATCALVCSSGGLAHADGNDCNPPGPASVHSILSNTYVIANNAFGEPSAGQQCINWQNAGVFSVATDTSAGALIGYPHIMQGQFFGEGPTTSSGLPIQVSAINTWPISWSISGTTASGQWDAAIEFWMTTSRPNGSGGQPDGAELMIWLNTQSNNLPGGLPVIGQVFIGGILWDVRASSWPAGNPLSWNYIAYYPQSPDPSVPSGGNITSVNMDFAPFFRDAETRTAISGHGAKGQCAQGTQGPGYCVYPNWWVTTVQAGFELFSGGVGLTSNSFTSALNGTPPPPTRRVCKAGIRPAGAIPSIMTVGSCAGDWAATLSGLR